MLDQSALIHTATSIMSPTLTLQMCDDPAENPELWSFGIKNTEWDKDSLTLSWVQIVLSLWGKVAAAKQATNKVSDCESDNKYHAERERAALTDESFAATCWLCFQSVNFLQCSSTFPLQLCCGAKKHRRSLFHCTVYIIVLVSQQVIPLPPHTL